MPDAQAIDRNLTGHMPSNRDRGIRGIRRVQVFHALWARDNRLSLVGQTGYGEGSVIRGSGRAITAGIKRVIRHEELSWLKGTHRELCVGPGRSNSGKGSRV